MSEGTLRAADRLQRAALSGAGWNYLASGVTLTAQIGYTAITARLIAPSGFGAYATAQAMVSLVGYFTLTTIGAAVMRRSELSRSLIGSSFVLATAAGCVCAAFTLAVAGVWARLWHMPDAVNLIRIFAFTVAASTISAVPLAVLRHRLLYRRAALTESAGQVAGMAIGAVVAIQVRSAIALPIGQAAAAAVMLGALLFSVRSDLALCFDRGEIRYLVGFASQVSGQNLVFYAINTAPAWFVARVFNGSVLGLYSRANVLVMLPGTHVSLGLTKALYPLYARVHADAPAARRLLTKTIATATGVVWPAFAALGGAALVATDLLLGPTWTGVATLLPPLAVFGCVSLPLIVLFNAAEAFRWMKHTWSLQLVWLAALAAVMATSLAAQASLRTMLWETAAVQAGVHLGQILVFARRGYLSAVGVVTAYAVNASAAALAYVSAKQAEQGLGQTPAALQALAVAAVVVAVVAARLAIGRALAHRTDAPAPPIRPIGAESSL